MGRDSPLLASYRNLRIQLWPDSQVDCDRDTAEIVADPASWAVFIAVWQGQPAGFLNAPARIRRRSKHFACPLHRGLVRASESRHQGFGRALMEAAEAWAASRGYGALGSDTEIHNAVSIAAHRRLGYREIERHVCFLKQLNRKTE